MESVFSRFESYNFGADRRFSEGARLLTDECAGRAELLDMKLFFYNRFVEPIDRSRYKCWKSGSSEENRQNHGTCPDQTSGSSENRQNHRTCPDQTSGSSENQQNHRTCPDQTSGSSEENRQNHRTRPDQTSGSSEQQQLSFADVMRLVQEGRDVPGVKRPDVQPSNQSPTPSVMERRAKPWETSMDL